MGYHASNVTVLGGGGKGEEGPPTSVLQLPPLTISSISRLLPTGVVVFYLVRLLVSYTSILQNSLQDLLFVRWDSSPGDGPQEETRALLGESSLPKSLP